MNVWHYQYLTLEEKHDRFCDFPDSFENDYAWESMRKDCYIKNNKTQKRPRENDFFLLIWLKDIFKLTNTKKVLDV